MYVELALSVEQSWEVDGRRCGFWLRVIIERLLCKRLCLCWTRLHYLHVVLGYRRRQQGRERIATGTDTVVVVVAAVVVGDVVVIRNWTLAGKTIVRLMVSGVPVVGLRPAATHF